MKDASASSNEPTKPSAFQFSLGRLLYVSLVLGVFLAEYRELGVHVGPVWVGTITGFAIFHALWRWSKVEGPLVFLSLLVIGGLLFPVNILLIDLPNWRFRCHFEVQAFPRWRHDVLRQSRAPIMSATTRPSDDTPLLSWRVALVEYFEGTPKFRQNEAWNSDYNLPLAENDTAMQTLRCQLETSKQTRETSYLAVTGPDTCWPKEGLLDVSRIEDGASNTMMLAEVNNSGVVWSQPSDLDTTDPNWTKRISGRHGPSVQYFDGSQRLVGRGHAVAMMADGSTRIISPDIDSHVLNQLANRRDSLPTDDEFPW